MPEPLAGYTPVAPGAVAFEISRRRPAAIVRLRSWLPFADQTPPYKLAGHTLPSRVGGIRPGPTRILCLGPREWLVISEERTESALRAEVSSERPTGGLVLVDLTDSFTTLEVSGSCARDVLSKSCGLDLHEKAFPPASCAATRLAHIAGIIECLDEPDTFALYVGRSYERYLYDWLNDAAVEFLVSEQE